MLKIINGIENIKKYIDIQLESISPEERNNLISTYYDLCMIQENLKQGSSGLNIEL